MVNIPNLEKLVGQSEYIFEATVDKLGEATLPIVPVTKETAVVLVTQLLRRPPGLGDFSGKTVTVQFTAKSRLSKRHKLLIFARGWLYGTSLALKESGHVRSTPSIWQQVIEAEQRLQERVLRQRVRRAEIIVTGEVSDVRLLRDHEESGEKQPEWSEVLLEVASWEKTVQKEAAIRVVYPAHPHPGFPRARRFHRGQEGIWMLRSISVKVLQGRAYIAEDVQDFQPLERLERVRSLIRGA
jgi:hypothetical protein